MGTSGAQSVKILGTTSAVVSKIIARTSVEGAHCWPDAPAHVAFLRSLHRHLFVIRAEKRVTHDDRQIEFISFAWEVQRFLYSNYSALPDAHDVIDFGTASCEMIARQLLLHFDLDACEVYEDGENGARAEKIKVDIVER